MSESRRQVFKTSILSALGLMSAPAALAQCPTGTGPYPGHGRYSATHIAAYSRADQRWYFFVFGSDPASCQVFMTNHETPVPATSELQVLDTKSWYENLSPNLRQVTEDFTLVITSGHKFDVKFEKRDNSGYLTERSLRDLYNVLGTGDSTQSTASWCEIGKP